MDKGEIISGDRPLERVQGMRPRDKGPRAMGFRGLGHRGLRLKGMGSRGVRPKSCTQIKKRNCSSGEGVPGRIWGRSPGEDMGKGSPGGYGGVRPKGFLLHTQMKEEASFGGGNDLEDAGEGSSGGCGGGGTPEVVGKGSQGGCRGGGVGALSPQKRGNSLSKGNSPEGAGEGA